MEEPYRKTITLMLILTWTSMGLYMEIGGPTMVDLRIRFDANSEEIARCISAAGLGIFIGALIGGVFVDMLGTWKFVLVSCSALLANTAVFAMPFVHSLSVLWFMFFMVGISVGLINVAGQRMILQMWKEKAPSPLHATHMGFGIGALIAPLVANPFLAVLNFHTDDSGPGSVADDSSKLNMTNSTDTTPIPWSSSFTIEKESRVEFAYVTIGIMSTIISLPFFIYPFVKCFTNIDHERDNRNMAASTTAPTNPSASRLSRLLQTFNPATYANGSFKFGLFVFVMLFLYYVNAVGGEQLFGNFVRTFSVDELHFSRNEASYVDTVYWGSFTLGRLAGSVMAHYLPIRKLLIFEVILNLVSVTLSDLFATENQASLWAHTAMVGFFVAPLFATGLAYADTQIEVGGVVLMLATLAAGIGQMFYIWVEGVLYQSYGPRTILYVIQTTAVMLCLIVAIFVFVSGRRAGRQKQHDKQKLVSTDAADDDSYATMSSRPLGQERFGEDL